MDHVRELIQCEEAYRQGLTGHGIGVAILDTGERVIIMSSKRNLRFHHHFNTFTSWQAAAAFVSFIGQTEGRINYHMERRHRICCQR